ncbi:hypothetical protein J4729_17725 [Leisingera sp. HS039]|uniref:hypothetical protein n=1 Tax=Leisingera sp. HS039 TaxID=2818496 RepID=UPI001B3A06F0|nr:hypothetical protein [Leisingera sp. HS039]MBQ4826373.1 hypothetical protein [Leisingera sp. HS039]
MIQPFRKKPEIEQRSLQTGLTPQHIGMRRRNLVSDGSAALSATVQVNTSLLTEGAAPSA